MTVNNVNKDRLNAALNAARGDTRMAGRVARYHTWPLITRQDISQHSWQVWRIMRAIWGPKIPWDVTEQVLLHDVGEVRTGDAPYPIKRDNPALKAEMDRLEEHALEEQGIHLQPLLPFWRWAIKVAHTIEMMELGLDELAAGNAFGSTIVLQMAAWLPEQMAAYPSAYPSDDVIDVTLVQEYVTERARRFVALQTTASDAHAWLKSKADGPAPRPGEPLRPGTPADGGHHATPEQLAGLE